MATVTSLTAERILQIAGGGGIGTGTDGETYLDEELRAALAQLQIELDQNNIKLTELNEVTLPALALTLAANDIALSDLNDTQLVNLRAALEENSAILESIGTVDIPQLQQDIGAVIESSLTRPKLYVQTDEPTNPDVDDRDLLVGDTWVNPAENNAQRIWTGVEWSTMGVDVGNLTVSVKQFMTSRHQIY